MSFETLKLSPQIKKALREKGYQNATDIQKELISAMFGGRDILAGAQTGTGKTAAFALPILEILAKEFEEKHTIKAMIIVPTRELAKQVHASFETYGKYLPLKSLALYGGANMTSQIRALSLGADIVIGTSGRILEHIKQKNMSVENVKHLVLDEADTILDMGFVNEVMEIFLHLPIERQNVFVSATLSGAVKRLADQILQRIKLIEVDSMGTAAKNVAQVVHPVLKEQKLELLSYLIGSKNYQHVLVFVRKKFEADVVAKELNLSGLKTAIIHGDKSSGNRSRALSDFKEGNVRVLVATDIAARGLDIPTLKIVINYDIPHVTGDYIHRIGRTGRAGGDGLAITLLSAHEEPAFKDVEKLLKKKIKREVIEGYEFAPPPTKKVANKSAKVHKKADGAFGRRKKHSASAATKKKRKVTKRDGFKQLDRAKGR